VVTLHILTTFF